MCCARSCEQVDNLMFRWISSEEGAASMNRDHRRMLGASFSRRTFLADTGMGFTGLALSALLWKDGVGRAQEHSLPDGRPHFAPKAKSVIWLFMCGGVSHVESFDVK